MRFALGLAAVVVVVVVVVVPLAGCFYNPGSYASNGSPFVGTRVQLACLDLTVARSSDPVATRGPIVAYAFGNRCLHEVVVDLATIRAIGIDAAGTRHPMRASDPRHELAPMQLDAMWKGDEQIEYVALDAASPDIPTVCIDVGGIDRSVPAREQWVCVGGAS